MITHRQFTPHNWRSCWITYLSRVSLEELVLNLSVGSRVKMPSSLFCCQDLVNLNLCGFYLNLPSTFGGFKHLRKLELSNCLLSGEGLEKLISSCPLLQRMILKSVDHYFSRLHIVAPKLRHLKVFGTLNLVDVTFGANKLISAIISFTRNIPDSGQGGASLNYSNLLHFFCQLPFIHRRSVGKKIT